MCTKGVLEVMEQSWGNISIEYDKNKLTKLKFGSNILLLSEEELRNVYSLMMVITKSKILYPAGYTMDLGNVELIFYKYRQQIIGIYARRTDKAKLNGVRISFEKFNSIYHFIEKCLKEDK